MDNFPIYTIGHGNRKPEVFLQLLQELDVDYLIDVRSQPYSKFNPQFNQNDLKFFLKKHHIQYVFMGDAIGGRPTDTSCYDSEGKVDYEVIKTKDFFLRGIARLKTAYRKSIKIAIMCSESKPCDCHRSKLIGKVLQDDKVPLLHIDEHGKIKDQITVINELNKGMSDITLFGEDLNSSSRKSYR